MQREAQTQAELIGNSVYSLVQEVADADKDLVAANTEVSALADIIANFTSVLLVHAERRQFLMSGDEYVSKAVCPHCPGCVGGCFAMSCGWFGLVLCDVVWVVCWWVVGGGWWVVGGGSVVDASC